MFVLQDLLDPRQYRTPQSDFWHQAPVSCLRTAASRYRTAESQLRQGIFRNQRLVLLWPTVAKFLAASRRLQSDGASAPSRQVHEPTPLVQAQHQASLRAFIDAIVQDDCTKPGPIESDSPTQPVAEIRREPGKKNRRTLKPQCHLITAGDLIAADPQRHQPRRREEAPRGSGWWWRPPPLIVQGAFKPQRQSRRRSEYKVELVKEQHQERGWRRVCRLISVYATESYLNSDASMELPAMKSLLICFGEATDPATEQQRRWVAQHAEAISTTRCHLLPGMWLIKTPASTIQIRDELCSAFGPSVPFFVLDVTGGTMHWSGVSSQVHHWLMAQGV